MPPCLFGTSGIRGDTASRVTPSLMDALGGAIAAQFGPRRVICGRDSRTSSPYLSSALCASLMRNGVSVLDAGIVPSPVLAYATCAYRIPGIMVTASHNPPEDNGIKVFDSGYEIGRGVEISIEAHVASPPIRRGPLIPGSWSSLDVAPSYVRYAMAYAQSLFPDSSLNGLTVLLDGGNGVGTPVLSTLLGRSGATVHTCNSHASGSFPGRPSEPSPENLVQTLGMAQSVGADMVFAQDGDADRLVVFGRDGHVVPEDTLLAAFSRFYARTGDCVVLSIDTSFRTDQVLASGRIPVYRVPLGYLHDGICAHAPAFAGEPWKHIHIKNGPWIDGIVSGLVLSHAIAGGGWDSFFGSIPSYPYRKLAVRLPSHEDMCAIMLQVRKKIGGLPGVGSIDETSGVRVNFHDGSWVLVRSSGTEPKLRIIIEGTTQKRFKELESLVDRLIGDV